MRVLNGKLLVIVLRCLGELQVALPIQLPPQNRKIIHVVTYFAINAVNWLWLYILNIGCHKTLKTAVMMEMSDVGPHIM